MKPITNSFQIQVGKLGRPFRLSATIKGKHEKWISGVLKYDWYHVFRYEDTGEFFSLHEDFGGKIIEKLNHKKTINLLIN